jgi:hypothetical protein
MTDKTVVKHGAKWLLLGAALLLVLSPIVKAQAQENIAQMTGDTQGTGAETIAPDDNNDPPSRVARISSTDGSVSMQPGGTGDWGTATRNRPVTIGDKLWSDANSRAELQVGQAAIHLGDMTALSFLNLNENVIQMRLAEGKINFRVRELREGDVYEVDTPNLAFTVTEAGAFRVDVNENGDFTSVTVIRGRGEIAAAGQVYMLNAGERADITGAEGNVHYAASTAAEPDALDRWAQERDLKEDNSTSARHVSRDVVGYSDLDDYGTWREDPQYGSVWTPSSVPPDWAPYSSGYWNYVGPWGWTWNDYEPWGFAPFHYGRWNYFGSSWGWCPGPIYARAFYGPAFVGFLGGGFGFGVGFGGGYGWFPLGWGEPFCPWYRGGAGYWRNVNVHNTFIRNANFVNSNSYRNFNYAYAHNMRAVTATSRSTFVNGQAINRGAMHLNEASLRNAQVTNRINATPTHLSNFGAANSHGNVARPSGNVENRSVVARATPAAGASHLPVRTMGGGANNSGFANGRFGNSPAATGSQQRGTAMQGMSANRQAQISVNRPPSAMAGGSRSNGNAPINSAGNSARPGNSAHPGNSTRTWNAQGNTTDSGRSPQGFGGTNRPSGGSVQSMRMNEANRPPWARSGASGNYNGSAFANPGNSSRAMSNRAPTSMGSNRNYTPPSYSGSRGNSAPTYNGNRGYNAPSNRGYSSAPSYNGSRGNSAPTYNGNRGYNAPSNRGYSSAPSYTPSYNGSRGYSAQRSYGQSASPSYSAPRSYSAPSSSGGGGYRGGGSSGGGGFHGGGGSPGGGSGAGSGSHGHH